MKKKERISSFVEQLGISSDPSLNPCYQGFFKCFNEQRYYEAHDVLEHLWLQNRDENYLYFKGLIQIAGAFVHLQKQFLRPTHPKDGKRLRPAVRLFHLGVKNLEGYRPYYLHFDVESLCLLCTNRAEAIIHSDFQLNPWHPSRPPQIFLTSSKISN